MGWSKPHQWRPSVDETIQMRWIETHVFAPSVMGPDGNRFPKIDLFPEWTRRTRRPRAVIAETLRRVSEAWALLRTGSPQEYY